MTGGTLFGYSAGGALAPVAAFLGWWKRELLGLLPHSLKRLLGTESRIVLVDAASGGLAGHLWKGDRHQALGDLSQVEDKAFAGQIGSVDEVIVRLASSQVLEREVTLPLATEGNLREVLGFEIDRLTPFKREMVVYDYTGMTRNPAAGTLSVRLFVAQKERVEALVASLERIGLRPTAVTVGGSPAREVPPQLPVKPNFLEGGQKKQAASPFHALVRVTGWLAFVLAVVAVALPLWNQHRRVTELEQAIQEVQAEVGKSKALSAELEKVMKDFEFVEKRRRSANRMLVLLNELSRVLPDDTWLQRLEINDRRVVLQGESADGSKVLSLIENSPFFENTRFAAPVVRIASTESDRFNVQADIVQEAGK